VSCTSTEIPSGLLDLILTFASYCKGVIGTALCRRLPLKGRQGEAEAGHKSGARHDHPHNHAHAAARGRSDGVQHVVGRSWAGLIRWHWWIERPDQRTARGHRAPTEEPRAVLACGYQASEGCPALRTSRYWKDAACTSRRKWPRDQLP
jgi:hypothetical protein